RKGLLGYYFKGANFNELVTYAPSNTHSFWYNQETANQVLSKDQQAYQSIRWVGLMKSEETGDFTFKFSDDENAIIEIDGKIVSNQGNEKQSVHLEKDKLVSIKIEYNSDTVLHADAKDSQNLKLFKIDSADNEIPIEQEDLRNPDFNSKQSQVFLEQSAKSSLFNRDQSTDFLDTDGDSIQDEWEEQGYTIVNKLAVKWTEELGNKGYTKFLGDPHESHTVGDPYTDYEKAGRDIEPANAKESFNPLVATYP
ncbi:hypothetical protein COD21_31960, partial [Bacillus cereus]|uniref:binary toxin-like calcium binding domain-containing protein n=1 Tax=Bacillus cereus TaxID=1396 RepID=UPI000C02D582